MIFAQLRSVDFYSLIILGVICSLAFLISGIIILVTGNTKLIAKDTKFIEEELFTKIYGIVSINFSSLMIAVLVTIAIKNELQLTMFLLLGIIVITMLLIQIMLQKKFRVKK